MPRYTTYADVSGLKSALTCHVSNANVPRSPRYLKSENGVSNVPRDITQRGTLVLDKHSQLSSSTCHVHSSAWHVVSRNFFLICLQLTCHVTLLSVARWFPRMHAKYHHILSHNQHIAPAPSKSDLDQQNGLRH